MNLWKRTLYGTVVILGSAIVVSFGAMLPPGVVPSVSTVLAIAVMPVVVVGGAGVLKVRHQHLAGVASPSESLFSTVACAEVPADIHIGAMRRTPLRRIR